MGLINGQNASDLLMQIQNYYNVDAWIEIPTGLSEPGTSCHLTTLWMPTRRQGLGEGDGA